MPPISQQTSPDNFYIPKPLGWSHPKQRSGFSFMIAAAGVPFVRRSLRSKERNSTKSSIGFPIDKSVSYEVSLLLSTFRTDAA